MQTMRQDRAGLSATDRVPADAAPVWQHRMRISLMAGESARANDDMEVSVGWWTLRTTRSLTVNNDQRPEETRATPTPVEFPKGNVPRGARFRNQPAGQIEPKPVARCSRRRPRSRQRRWKGINIARMTGQTTAITDCPPSPKFSPDARAHPSICSCSSACS